MVRIELSDPEAVILKEFLETELQELHTEIHYTDDRQYKDKLKQKQALLQRLHAALG